MSKEEIIVREVARAVKAGVTAIKVEFEGDMNRSCSTEQANDFLLGELAKIGLAQEGFLVGNYGENLSTKFKPKAPLIYSKVYGDYETEWTMTLSLKDPRNILYLTPIIKAYKKLAREFTHRPIETNSAGMHMAFLFNKSCKYPVHPSGFTKKYENFQKSVTPLIPALFFMSANKQVDGTSVTRPCSARYPVISTGKFSAIHWGGGALEFRVFDTCYEKPEQILDNAVVMSRCVSRYWNDKFVDSKIAVDDGVCFGVGEYGNVPLHSLYYAREHITLLNTGLLKIKPTYKSITEIKSERLFKTTKRQLKEYKNSEYRRAYSGAPCKI